MSTLRSALDELRAEDLRFVGDDEIASDLDELEHAGRIIESERARRLAEFERRGAFAADGHLSVSTWLADRHRVAHSTASAQVRLARALEQMPVTADALASGEVSSSAVGLLASAREACPERFALAEGTLVDAARTQPVAGLRRVVAYWARPPTPTVPRRTRIAASSSDRCTSPPRFTAWSVSTATWIRRPDRR